MSTTKVFDIARLKSVKPIGKTHIVRPPKRKDMMVKLRYEAHRILDDGRGERGVKGRQTQSRYFVDEEEWVNSFISSRLNNLPKKSQEDKMVRRAKHFVSQDNPSTLWEGILLLEAAHNLYAGSVALCEIDAASSRYWEMIGLA